MGISTSIDIVVAISRMNVSLLSQVVSMRIPPRTSVEYIFVIDGPNTTGPATEALFHHVGATVIENGRSRGAAYSRNAGFRVGSGEYVLFLDDDVIPDSNLLQEYRKAIDNYPDAPGYAGPALFKSASNSFTRGLLASGIPEVWRMAETHSELAWNVTSNIMVRRASAQQVYFSEAFPKKGGGEDIDYGLNLTSKAGRLLKSVPNARVWHGWWNGGSRQYRRIFRWGYGDSNLAELHPEHRFIAPPNFIEVLAAGSCTLLALAVLGLITPWTIAWWVLALLCVEASVELVRLGLAKNLGISTSVEVAAIKWANDLGRLAGNLRRGRVAGFLERFDYFGTKETVTSEIELASIKIALFLLVPFLITILFYHL